MSREEQAQIELMYAERAEANAAKVTDPHLKRVWEDEAKAAREAAAMLLEEAEV